MKPFTFSLLLLAQRADEALQSERLKHRPDRQIPARLRRRKRRLGKRMLRSFNAPLPAGG